MPAARLCCLGSRGVARRLVLVGAHDISQHREHAKGRSVLLDHHHSAVVFGAALAVLAGLYYFTKVSRVLLFWAAFIVTRPLGATVGDFLDKPLDRGGISLSRPIASVAIGALMIGCVLLSAQRAGAHPGAQPQTL